MNLQMDMQMSREEYLTNLREFIHSSNDIIQKFKEKLGLAEKINPQLGHNVSKITSNTEPTKEESINEYSEGLLFPPASLHPSPPGMSVTIDAEKQRNILAPYRVTGGGDKRGPPASGGELSANFTREERVALYEYTLTHTAAPPQPPEFVLPEDTAPAENETRELTGLELKKALRDFKRRRQAYRTKVSTKNKSQTQVMREVIENMMGLLGAETGAGCSYQPSESACLEKEKSTTPSTYRNTPTTAAHSHTHSDDLKHSKRREDVRERRGDEKYRSFQRHHEEREDERYTSRKYNEREEEKYTSRKYREKEEKYRRSKRYYGDREDEKYADGRNSEREEEKYRNSKRCYEDREDERYGNRKYSEREEYSDRKSKYRKYEHRRSHEGGHRNSSEKEHKKSYEKDYKTDRKYD